MTGGPAPETAVPMLLEIQGGTALAGAAVVGGSKNAALPLLAAACLRQQVELWGVPHTGDLQSVRGLFWRPAPAADPADGIYVHYGFTGTGMWISPNTFRELVFPEKEALTTGPITPSAPQDRRNSA